MTHPPAPPGAVGAHTSNLEHGLPLRDVLRSSTLEGSLVLAGAGGLDRIVQRMNVMEVPDILPWVKAHEFLLTTGYPLRNTPQSLAQLVEDLDALGLAGLAIKTGRYLDEVPPPLLRRAEELDFPVIRLPNEVSFDEVLNQVLTDILNRQASRLARAEEVHRALLQIILEGGGLPELAGEIDAHLGGPAVITGIDGRVLASSIPVERIAGLGAVVDEPAGRLPLPRVTSSVTGEEAAPASVVVPIIAGKAEQGTIAWFAVEREATADDVLVLEQAATVAALVVTRELAVRAVEAKYRGDFLHDVLAGRAGGATQVCVHARGLGWNLDRPLVVLVADLTDAGGGGRGRQSERQGRDHLAAAWSAALRELDPAAALAEFSRELVVVAGEPPGGDVRAVAEKLASLAHRLLVSRAPAVAPTGVDGAPRRFTVGASRRTREVEGLPEAYQQAVQALRVGRDLREEAPVYHFDDLGVFRLLSLVPDRDELQAFVDDVLGTLADPAQDELRTTLRVLIDTNGNVAESARILHYHYNTLRYRITKLERLLGPFLDDPQVRLQVHVALQVLRMREV